MRGRGRLVVACLAVVAVLFLAGFPARTYKAQVRQRQLVGDRVHALAAENAKLSKRVTELQTDTEIERLAREQYGLVRPGEEVYAVLGAPPAPSPPPAVPVPPSPHHKRWWERVLDVATSPF